VEGAQQPPSNTVQSVISSASVDPFFLLEGGLEGYFISHIIHI
jgi:hypothetical protein